MCIEGLVYNEIITHWGQVMHKCISKLTIIKSPQYTGGDFMFLYRFVRRRRRPAADSCSRDNFWTTFWISFIFGTIVGPDL